MHPVVLPLQLNTWGAFLFFFNASILRQVSIWYITSSIRVRHAGLPWRERDRPVRERRETEQREGTRTREAPALAQLREELGHLRRTVRELHSQMNEMRRQMEEMRQLLKTRADRKPEEQ